jgi:hypothetical protein
MTYQSYTWALDQDVPGDAWRVLLALANRTEHRTGKVYFDQEEIIVESKISPNSLSKYLGALRRNGYLAEVKKGKEKQYWLLLDRDPTKQFSWDAAESATESDEAPLPRLAPENAPIRFQKAAQAEQRKEFSATARANRRACIRSSSTRSLMMRGRAISKPRASASRSCGRSS